MKKLILLLLCSIAGFAQQTEHTKGKKNNRDIIITEHIDTELFEGMPDTIRTVTYSWAGYEFKSESGTDYKGRNWVNYALAKGEDTLKNSAIFNNKLPKLMRNLNVNFKKQFDENKAVEDYKDCLENITFANFTMDSLDMGIDQNKEFTFRAYFDVGMACLPVMYAWITLPYKDIKPYLIEDLK